MSHRHPRSLSSKSLPSLCESSAFAATFATRPARPALWAAALAAAPASPRASLWRVETLEDRRLLSASAFNIDGPAAAGEGSAYHLSLDSNDPNQKALSWSVNWGDGTAATVVNPNADGTFPATADHFFDNGPNDYTITATVTTATGTVAAPALRSNGFTTGTLDKTFGGSGVVVGPASVSGQAVVTTALGDMYVAGQTLGGGLAGGHFQLWHYNADGSQDTSASFNANVSAALAANFTDFTPATITLTNGGQTILVGGTTNVYGTTSQFALAEFNTNGTLVSSFGTNGEIVAPASVAREAETLTALAVAPDGSMVAVGNAQRNDGFGYPYHGVIHRFNASGQEDTTVAAHFLASSNLTPAPHSPTYAVNYLQGVAVDGGGNIFAVGQAPGGQAGFTHNHLAVIHTNGAGTLDPSFGTGGTAVLPGYDTNDSTGFNIALTPDGQHLLVDGNLPGVYGVPVVRFNTTGLLDTSFGQSGIATVTTNFSAYGNPGGNGGGAGEGLLAGLRLQSDGKIVTGGTAATGASYPYSDFLLQRFNADGTPDETFGTHGVVTTDLNGNNSADTFNGLTLTSDGKIVATGTASTGSYPNTVTSFALVRYGGSVGQAIHVNNVAPTVSSLTAPATGLEGSAINLSGAATDPSNADTQAGLTYHWTVTNAAGTFVADASAVGLTNYTFTPPDNGLYTVTLTAGDRDGGVSLPMTRTINVANVAPTVKMSLPALGTRGQDRQMTFSVTDPSTVDTTAGFTYSINWGDGTAPQTTKDLPSLVTKHAYANDGIYNATLTATDKDGGTNTASTLVVISPFYIQGTTLDVGGFTNSDRIVISQSSKGLKLSIDGLNFSLGNSTITQVNVFGQQSVSDIHVGKGVAAQVLFVDADGNVIQKLN